MFCGKCGKQIKDGARFCPYCGEKSGTSATSAVPMKPVTSEKTAASTPKIKVGGFAPAGDLGPKTHNPVTEVKVPVNTSGAIKKVNKSKDGALIQVKRSPRIMYELPVGAIDIEPPPPAGTKPEINWLSTFLPTAITLVIAVVMGVAMGNPMMMLYSLPMTVAGVVVSVINYRKQVKKHTEQVELRQKKYEQHITDTVNTIERKQEEQINTLINADPCTKECLAIAKERRPRLWERSPNDRDFASVRIGCGDIPFCMNIGIPKEALSLEEDALRNKPRQIKQYYEMIKGAPIVCDIHAEQICGVVGSERDTKTVIKNMIVQLATHHCYTELKLVCIYNGNDDYGMRWVKDLPHVMDGNRQPVLVATSKEEAKELFKQFVEVFKRRKEDVQANTSYGKVATPIPYYLFVILEPAFLEKSDPINEYLFMSRDLGVGCIMAVQGVEQLPKECNELIEVKGENGLHYNSVHASQKQSFIVDYFTDMQYAEFGRCLQPLCCDEAIAKETLPKNYSFYEMLGISGIREFDIGSKWRASNIRKSLAAPLGIKENGELLYLDLHEKAHGPHGLVAGTTGSGKSELLQSYILAMALNYHPYEVSFVIIDFKGGGMASQVAGLPHLIGTITNIDGQELTRSLMSIEAELHRRQKIMRDYNDANADKVKDIYDYVDRYKEGKAHIPLPHLIIVVDEFAELKAEQPEFMKKLISAARIGRSLGVHLILATQKPAGQVDDQIWSNTKFQMCLKVASPADSKEVIKSEVAAHLVDPGRAYLRVGNNELFELFQSGYSGKKVTAADGTSVTQMQAAISYIRAYCKDNGIKKLGDICLPPLRSYIDYPENGQETVQHMIPVGEYDDPQNQYQGQFDLDPFGRNLLLVGAARTGKTNMIQSMIRSLADRYTPAEVNIYIIDFASMILKIFENLNHVGGVVTPSEDEKFKNLVKLLHAQIELRKKKFLELGVSSYNAYLEAGKTDLPRIVLFVDNFTALKEIYLMDNDPIQAICQTGVTYGISMVVANGQTSGVSYQYLANFANRIALYCNNSSEYTVLFEKCKYRLNDIPGRCIVEKDNDFYQCQMYRAFVGEKEVDQAKQIKSYIAAQNRKYSGMKARPIPEIPETLYAADLLANSGVKSADLIRIPLGLDYENVIPFAPDLNTLGVLAVSGRQHFGRRNFLRYLVTAAQTLYPGKTQFYIADGIDRKLSDVASGPDVKEYVFLPDQAMGLVESVEAIVESRYEAILNGNGDALSDTPVIVLMLNSSDAVEAICNNSTILNAYNNIIGKYKNMNVCVVLGGVENANIPYSAPEILKKAKEERKLVLFEDLENLKIFDLPYSAIKKYRKPLELGDCYFIKGNDCVKLKSPKC